MIGLQKLFVLVVIVNMSLFALTDAGRRRNHRRKKKGRRENETTTQEACAHPGDPTCWLSDNSTALWCPGWVDPNTGCQAGPDYCMEATYPNNYYAPSLQAAEVCNSTCPTECNYPSEMHCSGTDGYGCRYSYCLPTGNPVAPTAIGMRASTEATATANGTCWTSCPTMCNLDFEMECDMGVDHDGCPRGGYCIAKKTISWQDQTTECPGVCSTNCNYPDEVHCSVPSTNGCYMGNTCAPCPNGDCDYMTVCGIGMRAMDREDHEILRLDSSPASVHQFYEKLRALQ